MLKVEKTEKLIDVSVISPLYYGKKYVKSLIQQIESNTEHLNSKVRVELILVNDAPEEKFSDKYVSEKVQINLIDTDVNRGIHGARIRGYLNSSGKYILFLDQDDKLDSEYLKKQLECIKGYDAVVCKAKQKGIDIYSSKRDFKVVDNVDYYYTTGNPIITPGQVLIRRDKIPQIWLDNALIHNGADDWFLWIAMLQLGCHFYLNEDVLFERVIQGENSSGQFMEMSDSEKEIVAIIEKTQFLDENKIRSLKQICQRNQDLRVKQVIKYRKMFHILYRWMQLIQNDASIAQYIREKEYNSVTVYGFGYLGKCLIDELKKYDVHIDAIVDENKEGVYGNINIISADGIHNTPMIILTMIEDCDIIKQNLLRKENFLVLSIEEILAEIEKKNK